MTNPLPLRTQIIWRVLAEAIANQDQTVAGACRRLITADRLGWQRHADPADWRLVKEFA